MATVTALPRVPVWTLRDRIVKAREDAGLTQEEFARRARVGRRTIARWESSPNPPSKIASIYAGVTGVPLWWFEGNGWDDDPGYDPVENPAMPTYADVPVRRLLIAA